MATDVTRVETGEVTVWGGVEGYKKNITEGVGGSKTVVAGGRRYCRQQRQ